MNYRLGIDIGSKTAKIVILDEQDRIVFSEYRLHKSNVLKTFSEVLKNTIWRFGNHVVDVCVTGSSGVRFAQDLHLPYVQEVLASRRALQRFLPTADVAIELGGEDAKILFLRDTVEERMNSSCAGGTGGFIDLMCGMLNVKAREFNTLAAAHTHIYPIASRCAVFAQADVRPLINAGARKSDIAASVMQAIVTQTISGLACGRAIEGTVAFLGGPCEVYSELVQRFCKTLGLSRAQALKPKDAHLFVASGAALIAGDDSSKDISRPSLTLQDLKDSIDTLPEEQNGSLDRLPPLFKNDEELALFKQRHEANTVKRSRLMNYEGDVFIGVDAGSTTLKLAAINAQGELLYSAYENNQGNVVETTRGVLDEFYRASPHEYDGTPLTAIRRSVVCGYGEDLLKAAFRFDAGEVETIAHLRAAQEFCPDASFVLDIGGQDIKCLRLRDGQIDDVMLNEACSSGCGALIQGFARSLGHSKWSFANAALEAESPVDLGTRCTVFMTSRVRHAQKEGISTNNLSAGLAYSVVRNALYKVMGIKNIAHIGTRVVVQGGTFMNDAVLRAFELESGLEVVRPDIANLMGAYGAALLARDEWLSCAVNGLVSNKDASREDDDPSHDGGESYQLTLLNSYEIAALKQKQSSLRCEACTNACNLAVSSFSFEDFDWQSSQLSKRLKSSRSKALKQTENAQFEERFFVNGNRCERGARWAAEKLNSNTPAKDRNTNGASNVMAYEQKLRAQRLVSDTKNPRIGIPPVLKLYEQYPFWQALFTELGFDMLPLRRSSNRIHQLGASVILSQGVCYPAKLMHGHIRQLIDDGAQYVFVPTFAEGDEQECPVARGYGHVAQSDEQAFSSHGAVLLSTDLGGKYPTLEDIKSLLVQAQRTLPDERIREALTAAHAAEHQFNEKLTQKAASELERLEQCGGTGIVLLGHPYHSDPGINHTIDTLIHTMGYSVFSVASLEQLALRYEEDLLEQDQKSQEQDKLEMPTSNLNASTLQQQAPAETWTQAARLYRIARFVAAHPNLQLVQLLSFGCGLDALTESTVQDIMHSAGKLYTAIKLDEMEDKATLRIRLRSLDFALSNGARHRKPTQSSTLAQAVKTKQAQQKDLHAADCVEKCHSEHPSCHPEHPTCHPERSEGSSQTGRDVLPEKEGFFTPFRMTESDSSHSWANSTRLDLPPVEPEDVDCGLARLNNDLCYQMIALGGQILRLLNGKQGSFTFELPTLCKKCRGVELESILNQTLPSETRITICTEPPVANSVEHTSSSSTEHAIKTCATDSQSPSHPRMGVLGNAAMLFTPQFNDSLVDRIQHEGVEPVLPAVDEVFQSEKPLLELLPNLYNQGIRDFIYTQSFGCLRSHVNARGVLPDLKEEYPDCRITFIEYDPGASQINQLNRLKLATAIAKEKADYLN